MWGFAKNRKICEHKHKTRDEERTKGDEKENVNSNQCKYVRIKKEDWTGDGNHGKKEYASDA